MDNKIEIRNMDITEDMRQEAIRLALVKLSARSTYNECAKTLKEEFDRKYYPSWHCVLGKSYGTAISYEEGNSIYFNINNVSILLWRAGYQC